VEVKGQLPPPPGRSAPEEPVVRIVWVTRTGLEILEIS
jgi:hypothetical protein